MKAPMVVVVAVPWVNDRLETVAKLKNSIERLNARDEVIR